MGLHRQRFRGLRSTGGAYTVLDLLVAMAILGVLLTLALPSYQRYVQRGHRAEAVRLLLAAAACEERIRASTGHYDTSRCVDDQGGNRYALRIDPPEQSDSDRFTIFAAPLREWPDDPCGTLSLDHTGRRAVSGDPLALSGCWGGR